MIQEWIPKKGLGDHIGFWAWYICHRLYHWYGQCDFNDRSGKHLWDATAMGIITQLPVFRTLDVCLW